MKQSAKARRLLRRQRRTRTTATLNLVSLMDIFTILVFFLMVNSSNVQVMQSNIPVALPESASQQELKETLVLTVTNEEVLVAGQVVARLEEVRQSAGGVHALLKQELGRLRSLEAPLPESAQGYPVTIMAERELPYQVLKTIMATCVSAGYPLISLAVTQTFDAQTANPGV